MNGMNEQRFLDLAMKLISRQSSVAERTELEAALATDQRLRTEFEKLRGDVAVAKEMLPLVQASQATKGELPGYARERLQTKVRQTLGRPQPVKETRTMWSWRWLLALAPAAALFVLFLWLAAPHPTVVQVAMLDTVGATRGGGTNETAALKNAWPTATPEVLSTISQGDQWSKNWPSSRRGAVVKIIYDKGAGEVRVTGRKNGRTFERSFPVGEDLGATLKLVQDYVAAETGR
jgi:hypothetical protein